MKTITVLFTHPDVAGVSATVSIPGTTVIGVFLAPNQALTINIAPGTYTVNVTVTTQAGTSWSVTVTPQGGTAQTQNGTGSGFASVTVTV